MCEKGKIPSETSLGQMGRQLHAGGIKPEPGFCSSGFGFFQSVRFPVPWIRVWVNKLQITIMVKTN